jgi:formylglycine-generating enzyme required for sulfatase activity
MDSIRKHYPWMTVEEEPWLQAELLQRAAVRFEQVEMWRDAAECWTDLGEQGRAGELYVRSGDTQLAAPALLTAGRYIEAIELYQAWEADLSETDVLNLVKALLGQASCHLLGASASDQMLSKSSSQESVQKRQLLSRQAGQKCYRRARTLFENEKGLDRLTTARCWAALGEYGIRLDRFDLVHEGYETALTYYEETAAKTEKIDVCQSYLTSVFSFGDRSLKQNLEERLASWGAWLDQTELPNWQEHREIIERYGFRNGLRNVLNFTQPEQWAAWYQLAEIEDDLEVDNYLRGLAPLDMIYIPAGSFLMGSADDDPDARENEKPQHEVWLRGYYIDRYPVTNAQYREFIDGEGYQMMEYWTEEGWVQKKREKWQEPRHWKDTRLNNDHQPVVGVSWYEAIACARWMGKTLPSEAEWEKAAAWDPITKDKRRYPWGNKWNSQVCHTQASGVYGSVPVRQYSPMGDSAFGVADLGGNVNEWCRSRSNYNYPYVVEVEREELEGEGLRGLRGGSWNDQGEGKWGRVSFRDGFYPQTWSIDRGFRCVCPDPQRRDQ